MVSGGLFPGGVCSRGVSALGGLGSGLGGRSGPRGGGCLLPGGLSGPGGCLPQEGGLVPGGSAPGGGVGIPAYTEADPLPPVNRMNDRQV